MAVRREGWRVKSRGRRESRICASSRPLAPLHAFNHRKASLAPAGLGDAGTLATLDMNRKTNTRLIQTFFRFPSFPPSQRGGAGGEASPGPPPSSNSLAVPHITIVFFFLFFFVASLGNCTKGVKFRGEGCACMVETSERSPKNLGARRGGIKR